MIISQTDDACAAAALLRWTSLGLWRLHSEWYSWWIQIWLAETDVLNGFHSLKARGATLGYDNGSHRHGTNCCHGHAATGAVTPQVRSRNYGSSQRNPPTKKCWQGSKRFRFKHLKTCFCSSDPVMKPRLKSIFGVTAGVMRKLFDQPSNLQACTTVAQANIGRKGWL